MRLLYSFPGDVGTPGIGTTAYHQIQSLVSAGVSVTVSCGRLKRPFAAEVEVQETLAVAGRRIPRRLLGGMDNSSRYHDALTARRLANDADIDIVHTWPVGALTTLRTASTVGIPSFREAPNTHTAIAYSAVALECSRIGFRLSRGHSHRWNNRRLRREHAEYVAARKILVPSDHVASSFLAAGFRESELARHQYGFDPSIFRPEPGFTSQKRLVFLGRAEPRKGLHIALSAWRASGLAQHGWSFHIYGSFEPGYRSCIEEYLNDPGVTLMGFTDDPAAVLRESDALILPSVEEGSALVTYEAQACGCVPLVSTATGARVENGATGWIHDVRDTVTLAEQLRLLANDSERRHLMRSEAIARSRSLSWEAAGRTLASLYDAAIRA